MSDSSGIGHQKVFEITRTIDPETLAQLEARRMCRADSRLNRSMKACFDEIADRALNPSFYDAKGVVTISDTALAEIFNVSNRTIYSWKHKIAECGYVWIGKKFKTNMWPLTTYHLSCLHKKPIQQKTDSDGTYGARQFRSAPANPGLGARAPGQPQLPLAGTRNGHVDEKNGVLLGISAEARKTLPPSAEDNCGSEPNTVSGESRNGLRLRAEVNCGPEPKPIAGQSRNGTPARAEADCRFNKAKVQGEGSHKGNGFSPPDRKGWEKRLKKLYPRELQELKSELLKQRARLPLNDPAKKDLQERIDLVDVQLYGAKVPEAQKRVAMAKAAPMPSISMTEEELLDSARKIMTEAKEARIKPLLTDKQKTALKAVGELT